MAKSDSTDLTARQAKLVEAGASISMAQAEGDDLAFTHSVLCQVGLPRSRVDGREFLRRNGDAWVNIQAGLLDEGSGPVMQPVPYGAMPRLALAWVTTYAIRHDTREVPLGESASEFLRMLSIIPSGGERGSFTTLRRQMHALAASRIQLGFKGRTFNGQPVEQFDAWLAGKDANQRTLWPGVMKLSEGYFNEVKAHGVPLDNRALLALKKSSLALDVYCWLAHRLHRIDRGAPVLRWNKLREQFAQEYTGKEADKDFKKKFLPALNQALAVYPKARVQREPGGIRLFASPPPIGYKE